MNSPYAYDATAASPPDPSSPNYQDWVKQQRQQAVVQALTQQLTQPQGAQQSTGHMASSQSPLGAIAQMADMYSNPMIRQRMQQMMAARGGMGYGTADPTQAGAGLDGGESLPY